MHNPGYIKNSFLSLTLAGIIQKLSTAASNLSTLPVLR